MEKYLFFNNYTENESANVNTKIGVYPLSTLRGVTIAGSQAIRLHFLPEFSVFYDGAAQSGSIGDSDYVDLTVPGDYYTDLTGSINVGGANVNVPGTNTLFLTELAVGDKILVTNEIRTIATIADDTTATTTVAWSAALTNDTSPQTINGNLTVTDTIKDLFRKIHSAPSGSLITVFDARNTSENIINVTAINISRQTINA